VETLTVTEAEPGEHLTLLGDDGPLLTLIADELGQAHFAYLPAEPLTLPTGPDADLPEVAGGRAVPPGTYEVVSADADPPLTSGPVEVLGRDDHPDESLYEEQVLPVATLDVLGGSIDGSSAEDGFGYIQVRDGVLLSTTTRMPDPALYGDGPYPTVIEYSGYGPSNPGAEEPGVRIARALGYATVSVNLRGTGCSGGVFDVFNPAQMADGYDVVEVVARQPWVLHGHVGMVGLSYSGITQLYTAATRPPSLAAILPQSVIRDSWEQAWPGGVYNAGFTREWVQERDRQAAAGGTDWAQARVDAGDEVCAAHMDLRNQNPDFESFTRALVHRPADADNRSLPLLVGDIDVPVFLTGAFQDEQTGPQFTAMLDGFDDAPIVRVGLWNGRHPDGYGPQNLGRWYEFLELYVAERVPAMNPLVAAVLPSEVASTFELTDVEFQPPRPADGRSYDEVLAAYEAEDPVRVVFESGTAGDEPGEPGGSFELTFPSWPPPDAEELVLQLGADGALAPVQPADAGADRFRYDPSAGAVDLFPDGGYPLLSPTWDEAVWTQFAEGDVLSYLTEPLAEPVVLGGPALAELHLSSDAPGVPVMVTLSEVRSDGVEYLIQNGVVRADATVDEARTDGLEVAHDFSADGVADVGPGEVHLVSVELPAANHVLRAGSQLRVTIATPGRNYAAWSFANLDDPELAGDAAVAPDGSDAPTTEVHRGGDTASAIRLTVLPGVEPPAGPPPPCPSLRGQVCRPYEARTNATAGPSVL
jgi:predicted acyl esterase